MTKKKREMEQLARRSGATFERHGVRHDIWRAPNGKLFAIPRHERDLSPGVEREILKALGLR